MSTTEYQPDLDDGWREHLCHIDWDACPICTEVPA